MQGALTGFSDWFCGVWGRRPFPWQRRLAEDESWPTSIAAPTSSGKTAAIDAWLWRRLQGVGPRRLWYIVDRRVLVDAAYERARALVETTGADCEVVRLRGGVFEEQPLLSPSRTAILCSTVDQFGSRLLFSGYGLGRTGRVMHAALAGVDALVLVDEAHLSNTLLETATAARRHGADIEVTPMTATPRDVGERPLTLSEDDWTHPDLRKRLRATKRVVLGSGRPDAVAWRLRRSGARSIAVWCNTVEAAVETADILRRRGTTLLLTGRQRLHDRDQLLDEWRPRLESDAGESPEVFVVSTQVLEVGIDWDFDAMVTQCADIATLKQRLGRLDRLGRRGESEAVILKPPRKVPVYGESAKATWDWLSEIADNRAVNFGVSEQEGWKPPDACTPPLVQAPLLLPCHLDAWALTSASPIAPVAPWLHPDSEESDCRICWRGDLVGDEDDWLDRIASLPPALAETASVATRLVRDRVQGNVVIWRGRGESLVASASSVRPGDTVVIPESAGCLDLACLAPDSTVDLAEIAQAAVRLTRSRLPDGFDLDAASPTDLLLELSAEERERLGDAPDIRTYPDGWVFARSRATPSVQSATPVGLAEHSRDVAQVAERAAETLGMENVNDIRLAASWHDAGKADPRFQAWLAGGVWDGEHVLAKSGHSWAVVAAARRTAGYPHGQRHELLSAAMFAASEDSAEAHDLDLVLHLIECHHGWARPVYPVPVDDEPVRFSVEHEGCQLDLLSDAMAADENRLWRLTERYGYWGLALRIALVMYADHQVSAGGG